MVVGLPRAEVGQGLTTAFAQIVADELDARIADVDVQLDDARPELLFNQLTGGSNSVHSLYAPMRTVAAAARARLVTAAAQRWGLPAAASAPLTPRSSRPTAARCRSVRSLRPRRRWSTCSSRARRSPTPSCASTGSQPTASTLDRIVTGAARYALDIDVPGAVPVVVARPPTLKGTVRSFDAERGTGQTRCHRRSTHPHRRGGGGGDVRPGRGAPAMPSRSSGGPVLSTL